MGDIVDIDQARTAAPTAAAPDTTAAVETAPVETTTETPETEEIALTEDGGLEVADSFWESEDKARPEEAAQPQPQAGRYTPEELAEAFINGTIDQAKLTPEVAEYYKAIDAAAQRRNEAARLQREMLQRAQQAQPPQAQLPQAQAPQAQAQPPISKEAWAQLMEMGKVLAAKNYLGIKPEEFDEFDPKHMAAQNSAVVELRERAQQLHQAQQAQQARQAQEAQIARQAQVQAQVRQAEIVNAVAEIKQKTPEFDEIDQKFFPQWKERLPFKEYQAVDAIFRQGSAAQVRDLMNKIIADYKATKAPTDKTAATSKTATPKTATPPPVMTAGNAGGETQGVTDVSKLGEMSSDEQVDWLIKNKFV
ncbi:MAG: hypothetical protein LBQ42_12510 [Synergistaceae bacterium]|jgi:hypothetical protein|nr:hypothetical protein [Synergistaceae bacterium]